MKYIIALIASAGVILFWAVLSAEVGWNRGGGIVGMLFMWAVIAGIWGTIMAMSPSKSSAPNISGTTNASTPHIIASSCSQQNKIPPNITINDAPFYETAINECEGGSATRNISTWAKAFSLTEGDEQKAKAKYIELRVAELVSKECERVKNERREEIRSHLDSQLNEAISKAQSQNMTESQRIFSTKYPVGLYLPLLVAYYGGRVSRTNSESDSQYARRLARFASDFEKDTGRILSDIVI